MKRQLSTRLLAFLFAVLVLGPAAFAACDSGLRIVSVEIETPPGKTVYTTGDTALDFTGGTVKLTTLDGHVEYRDLQTYAYRTKPADKTDPGAYIWSDVLFNVPGEYTVTVVQNGRIECSYTVTVTGLPSTEKPAPMVFPEDTDAPKAADHNGSSVITLGGTNTFYGTLPEIPAGLPAMELEYVLLEEGVTEAWAQGWLKKDAFGSFWFSLDLSALTPTALTPDGEIVCRLAADTKPFVLFVLDAQAPATVQYYLNPYWAWNAEPYTLLLDGYAPSEVDALFCEKVLQAHLNGRDRYLIMDDNPPHVHTVTLLFTDLPGLAYRFSYFQYPGYTQVYSRAEDFPVRVK